MASPASNDRASIRRFVDRHRLAVRTVACTVILLLPFLLYTAAQAGQDSIVKALLALMAVLMLALILIG